MKKIIQSFLLILILTLCTENVFGEEIWLQGNTSSRHFITIVSDQDQIEVKVFYQNKGDYQDKVASFPFQNINDAKKFISTKFPNYHLINQLESWPVDTSVTNDLRNKEIWSARNEWSDYWEKEYANWLSAEVDENFYIKYNIPTDCADAVIGYRWIFSRINSLPVANTVSDTGSLFGHFSMRQQWTNLSTSPTWYEDKLFLTALNYVMDMTSTRTIMNNDGFPVSITKKGLQAGSFIVAFINGSGHLRTITHNSYDNPNSLPLFTFSSTAPREVRSLYREAFIDQAWPIKGKREIMAFRWPIIYRNSWRLKQKEIDPRYSQEQFNRVLEQQYYSFIQFVLTRVQPHYDPTSLVTTGVNDIVNYTNMRVKIVRDGYAYCRTHDCRKGTQAWEDWSTPNRDAKYLIKFSEVESLVSAFDPMYPGFLVYWRDSLDTTIVDVEGYQLSLSTLRSLFKNNLISSNPSDSILKRWGL